MRVGRTRIGGCAIALAAVVLLCFGTWLVVARSLSFDAPEEFWRQKGELAEASATEVGGDSAYRAYELTLTSTAGYSVRGYLRAPRHSARTPALLLIGGVRTGRMSAELVTPPEPHVILGLDYPWEGPTQLNWLQFLVRLFAVRRAMLLTPSAVILAVDYLRARPDVDTAAIVLAGASFGAQLAVVAGALDERVGTVISIYGGGDYATLLRANLKFGPGWLRTLAARLGAWLLAPLEPLDYVGSIVPRRLLMINGLRDDRVPPQSVGSLYDAAGRPKQLLWLDEGHISPRDRALVARVLAAAVRALEDRAPGPGASGA
jgi:hypothetical protein